MELTVLTPTYNRAYTIENLYKSLKQQTQKDFEWLVVDDGSTDETKQLVQKYAEESDFSIRYIYKENGGKHTALNAGIKEIDSELTFIVDSDDSLSSNAIETISSYHKKYSNDKSICGYSFLRLYPDGKVNGRYFMKDEWITSLIDARINSDDASSDKAEIYKTAVLKEYPFPEYPGEKFLGEDIVWIRIAKKFKMVHVNKGIYIGDYLGEGLTQNRRLHNINSPIGCMNRAKEFLCKEIRLKYRIKAAVQYIVYGKYSNASIHELIENTDEQLLVIAMIIPGNILYMLWKLKYRDK